MENKTEEQEAEEFKRFETIQKEYGHANTFKCAQIFATQQNEQLQFNLTASDASYKLALDEIEALKADRDQWKSWQEASLEISCKKSIDIDLQREHIGQLEQEIKIKTEYYENKCESLHNSYSITYADLDIYKQREKELEEQLQDRELRVKEIITDYETRLQQKLYAERKRIKYSIDKITGSDKDKIPKVILSVKRILINAELSNGAYEYFGSICSTIESELCKS